MTTIALNFSTKAIDEDQRLVEGWASRPEQDRVGDIVLPRGVTYKLPLPFMLDHDHQKTVGDVEAVDVSDQGVRFRARIKKIAEPGPVRELCETAWALLKNQLRKHVSIGFRVLEAEPSKSGRGLLIKRCELLEISAVSVPALASAEITRVKTATGWTEGRTVGFDPEMFGRAMGEVILRKTEPLRQRVDQLERALYRLENRQ